jgi:hypothetical protein
MTVLIVPQSPPGGERGLRGRRVGRCGRDDHGAGAIHRGQRVGRAGLVAGGGDVATLRRRGGEQGAAVIGRVLDEVGDLGAKRLVLRFVLGALVGVERVVGQAHQGLAHLDHGVGHFAQAGQRGVQHALHATELLVRGGEARDIRAHRLRDGEGSTVILRIRHAIAGRDALLRGVQRLIRAVERLQRHHGAEIRIHRIEAHRDLPFTMDGIFPPRCYCGVEG